MDDGREFNPPHEDVAEEKARMARLSTLIERRYQDRDYLHEVLGPISRKGVFHLGWAQSVDTHLMAYCLCGWSSEYPTDSIKALRGRLHFHVWWDYNEGKNPLPEASKGEGPW